MNALTSKYHFDWGMFGAIFAMVVLSNGLMMWQFTRLENRFDGEMKCCHQRADAITARLDHNFAELTHRLDHSYEILIDLVKNK